MADPMYDTSASPTQDDAYHERRSLRQYSPSPPPRSPTHQATASEHRRPSRSPPRRRSRSRSRSQSRQRYSRERSRYRSRSPDRRRDTSRGRGRSHDADEHGSFSASKYTPQAPPRRARENPTPAAVLGVFNLSYYTTEKDLEDIFAKYGELEKVVVVMDRKMQRSRGFAFIYFKNIEDATAAREGTNGMKLSDRELRVDFSVTQRAHDPTPGLYMGEREERRRDDRYTRRPRSRSRSRDRYRSRRDSPRRSYARSPRRTYEARSPPRYRRDRSYSR
ncbi:hypothetical protein THASP1DRAFT_32749 [Thamnocephalis sphaerospora]|uniref:RRM domain-containing protein n=1 Tax=Thamnocephalis sphaerospora TaxID=78915 RepID=A0A4P9XIA4_9FUNG|nr:hypothetical protein THASP1DRAFT_32749 [Thamnocephalis sphaerospora]|eukprot:RKP05413.1 hypothetical protein THASP1DRAFT_32749 [Thamnocephalis sphaerospora]